jgi:60 kDa SS-A/Ro ribonucleoprotein
VDAVNSLRGWGKNLRRAVADWYLSKTPEQLAMQVTKYAQREGWSHRDVLRLAHPKTNNLELNNVLRYVTQRDEWFQSDGSLLEAVEMAKEAATANTVANLILDYGLVREHIPTEFLNDITVWDALLEKMPATAMLRNLGKMTSIGLITPLSDASQIVASRLRNSEFIRKGRLHPFSILQALATYKEGHGFRGSLSWDPVPAITASLDKAFYTSFGSLNPTNKRFLLGIDVSGSMSWAVNESNVNCAMAAACMAMVAYRTEPQAYAFGFARDFRDLGIAPNDSLEAVLQKTRMPFGPTDCAVPMTHALEHKIPVDVFCVYTDNETWVGNKHPHIALQEYRQAMGIDAKLIVFGMATNDFTIADPNDPGMLDVVGFDSAAPKVMENFVR